MDDKQVISEQQFREDVAAPPATSPNGAVHVESKEEVGNGAASFKHASNLEDGPAEHLSPEHREYLISRHGTTDLSPLPSMDPADPLNWPSWKVLHRASFRPFGKADHCRKMSTCSSSHFTQ